MYPMRLATSPQEEIFVSCICGFFFQNYTFKLIIPSSFLLQCNYSKILILQSASTKTLRTNQKKVAQWDKVVHDYMKDQRMDEMLRGADKSNTTNNTNSSDNNVVSTTTTTITTTNTPSNNNNNNHHNHSNNAPMKEPVEAESKKTNDDHTTTK